MTTQTDSNTRTAIIRGGDADRVAAYLPANYRVDGTTPDGVLIVGTDNADWTLADYVLPRLASGLMFGTEITRDDEQAELEADLDAAERAVNGPGASGVLYR